MTTLVSTDLRAPWKRRLTLPAYQVKDAARYADVTSQTVRNWQRATEVGSAISARQLRESLSYLQLQELAIVAAMREQGVTLKKIRLAREWLSTKFNLEFPFSDERVKADGQDVLMEERFVDELGKRTMHLMVANRGGQYVWSEIIRHRFSQFEYEDRLAVRWHVRGRNAGVVIDPRISFGAPTVRGVPTWAVRGRYTAGESVEDLAEDFLLTPAQVKKALTFEGVELH